MAGQTDDGNGALSSTRGSGGSGAPPFADFSSFREMIREEREAARSEREAAAERARVEREATHAEQQRLMTEVFELRLQLARGKEKDKSGAASGEPWMTGSRGKTKTPKKRARQSGAAAGGDHITNQGGTTTGLCGRMQVGSMSRICSVPPSPETPSQTNITMGDSGAVPIQRKNELTPHAGDQPPAGMVATLPPPPPVAAAATPLSSSSGVATAQTGGTLPSVQPTVANVAESVKQGVSSGVWAFFQKLDQPVADGKSARCIVANEQGNECGRMYKHIPKNGTRPLLGHLKLKHFPQYQTAMAVSRKSTKAKQARRKAFAAAARGQPLINAPKKTPLAPQLKHRLDRLSVIWCIRDGRPWRALKDAGHKLLMAEFVPEYAATDTSHATLDKILSRMYDAAKASLVAQLKGAYEDLNKMGYHGPFCCLKLELTSIGNDEFCTASVSVTLPAKKTPVHLSLATKVFRSQHTQATVRIWIQELTTAIFESFIPAVAPEDVYIAACVNQGLGVVNACKHLNLPTLLCLVHRIHTTIMWGLGISGSSNTPKNKDGRALVGRCAEAAGMFSHSCTNNGAFRALQEVRNAKEREEMEQFRIDATDIEDAAEGALLAADAPVAAEEIPRALTVCRRSDTRWVFMERFMMRLCVLEEPIGDFLKTRPDMAHRGLSPAEWSSAKELCSILEPLKVVTHKIQGGVEGLLSRAIYLCHDVGEMLREDDIETIDWASRRARGNDSTPGPRVKLVDLSDVAYTAVKVIGEEFKKRNIGVPVEDVELLALFFDPRTKEFGKYVCGGKACKDRAIAALSKVSCKLVDTIEVVDTTDAPTRPPVAPPPNKRQRVATTAYERRQARKIQEAAATVRARRGRHQPFISDRLDREVEEYNKLPAAVPSKDYDVFGFWQDAGSPCLDRHGNVVSSAQFPILSMLARVFLCVDSTSCQSERECSGLGLVYNNLRQELTPDRVEMVMFLRSNSNLIPEIKQLELELGKLLAAQSVGKPKVASVQAARAGEQVVLKIESE